MIVVGVDGSPNAEAALEVAAAEARLRNEPLRVVAAWEVPSTVYGGGFAPVDTEVFDSFRDRARAVTEEAAKAAGEKAPDVRCEVVVEEGDAATVLLDQAKDATLIVVGSRGLGGFKSFLLGSVSQRVVHHATCPVLVVPAREAG
jgi:nucleotide-binding universal stress UspA family protein